MHRFLVGFLATALMFSAACEGPQNAADTDTSQTAPDDTLVSSPDTTGSVANGDAAASTDGTTAVPGVALQTILDRASDRDPQTQELRVLDQLNDPQFIDVQTHPNRHYPDQTDTLRTYNYEGLQLTVHHASGKELLDNVTVTGQQYETDDGLSVGISRSEVEDLRGQPDQQRNGAYVYDLGGPMPTMLHVAFSGDEVSRLEWRFPID